MIQKIFQWLQIFFRVSIPKSYKLLAFGGSIALSWWLIYALWLSPSITLGLIAPLSGDFAVLAGKEMVTGAKLAVEQANQAGGVVVGDRRYPVRLIIADDGNKPESILQAADQLRHRGVQALVTSPQSSLNSLLVAALTIESFPMPLITSATDPVITFQTSNPTSNQEREPYNKLGKVISIGLDQELQGYTLAHFAHKTLQAKNVVIFHNPDNSYSRNLVTAFQQNFQDLGGRVVIETYKTNYKAKAVNPNRGDSYGLQNNSQINLNGTKQDFLDRLQRISQQQPDVLLLPNPLPDLISQGLALQELAIEFPVIGGDSWAGIITANLPLLEGGFFLSPWHPRLPTPENQKFIADYTRAYRQAPRSNAALTYDAVQMILGAIATQQQLSPEAIGRGIFASPPFLGITGQILAPADRGRSMVINQVKNGEAEFYQQVAPVPKIPQ